MATSAVQCLQITGRTYTHMFLCGGCRCLSSGSMQVAFAAIGAFAFLIAFNWPMSESTHIALIVGGSISLVLTMIGMCCCKIPKRVVEEPTLGLEHDIPVTTPPPRTPFFDMTGMVASINPANRTSHIDYATLTPTVVRQLQFGESPEHPRQANDDLTTAYARLGFTSLDAGEAWRSDPTETFTVDPL
jgi:hypothetical protein